MKKRILIIVSLLFHLHCFSNEINKLNFINSLKRENEWLPIEYLNVIKTKNRNTILTYVPTLNIKKYLVDYLDKNVDWYDEHLFQFQCIYFKEENMNFGLINFDYAWEYSIEDIKENEGCFYLNLLQTEYSLFCKRRNSKNDINNGWWFIPDSIVPYENLRKAPLYSENPEYYDNDEYKYDEIVIDAKFIFDGDYLTVYANNDKFKQVYFRCTEETFEQLKSLIYTNTIDLSRVTWPRHADGTCDYEEGKLLVDPSSSATNVSINKTMSVKENLKLRSAEATTSTVLNVMAAGTKVKVLELGKAETIDGINSNWVKVEIISGKDRNGNALKSGTTGWCYGGYLQ